LGVTAGAYLEGMKNRSGASLLHVLAASRRPLSELPFPAVGPSSGGPGETTARALARRLALVVHDLGLGGVLPAGWISVDGAAIRFGAFDVPTADQLVARLENIAAEVAGPLEASVARRRTAGSGRAGLFDDTDR
jgi:hypothetical protein